MQALIGLGSNIEPDRNLAAAIDRIAARYPIVRRSRAWRTPPVRVAGGPFLNMAIVVEADAGGLADLRHRLRAIEQDLGRPAGHDPAAARTIDLDVLAVRDHTWHVVEAGLAEQAWQLMPAVEVVPELVLPDGRPAARVVARRPMRGARPARPVRPATASPVKKN